ncbi:hypothetical protein D3C79_856760 [compost metagenome]
MKYRGRVEQRPMVLAAVETVTNTNPERAPRRDKTHFAAQTTAGESVHAVPPSGRPKRRISVETGTSRRRQNRRCKELA